MFIKCVVTVTWSATCGMLGVVGLFVRMRINIIVLLLLLMWKAHT